jgi:hypothetical protein
MIYGGGPFVLILGAGLHPKGLCGVLPSFLQAVDEAPLRIRENVRWGTCGSWGVPRLGDFGAADPAPAWSRAGRRGAAWGQFPRAQAGGLSARDLFTVETAGLTRLYVSRCWAHPAGGWVAQRARNLLMYVDESRSARSSLQQASTLRRSRRGRMPMRSVGCARFGPSVWSGRWSGTIASRYDHAAA